MAARVSDRLLIQAAWATYDQARDGLQSAFEFLLQVQSEEHVPSSVNLSSSRRARLALSAIAYSCDALKSAANACANVIGLVDREGSSRA